MLLKRRRPMKSLHIEWKHLEVNGRTCRRCAETGQTLTQVIKELTEELLPRGISVTLTETKLPADVVSQSNVLFFNGVALEEVLPDVTVSENSCASCGDLCGCVDLCGKDVKCRTVMSKGMVYEALPAALIREAALKTVFAKHL
jgi:hypothetical protein